MKKLILITGIITFFLFVSGYIYYETGSKLLFAIKNKILNTYYSQQTALKNTTIESIQNKHIKNLMSIFDGVPLYQKNGRVEMFGNSLRQRMSGPISVSHSEIKIYSNDSWLMWKPDQHTISDTKEKLYIYMELEEKINNGSIEIILSSNETNIHSYEYVFGAKNIDNKKLTPLYPKEHLKMFSNANKNQLLGNNKIFFSEINNNLKLLLNKNKNNFSWFFRTKGMTDEIIKIKNISIVQLIDLIDAPSKNTIDISGTILQKFPPGTNVSLLQENGVKKVSTLSFEGKFAFQNISKEIPFSIRFNHNNLDYYSNYGRWMKFSEDVHNIEIDTSPRFKNPSGLKPNSNEAKFVTPRNLPSPSSSLYEAHARIVWPGHPNTIKEYLGYTFTNNHGFIDRDRFDDNPDNCLRLLHLGSSHAVALQVPIFEKYNIILESELAVKLGRCVEVMSAGRDNGDLAANYPILRDYGNILKPDLVIFENSSSLIMQLQPELLKLGTGWDAKNNALAGFLFNKNGKLIFKDSVPDYGIYTTKPTWPELVQGVQFFKTLWVSDKMLPELGRKAMRKFGLVANKIQKLVPDIPIIVHNGLDQAQCKKSCELEVSNKLDGKFKISVANFVNNHSKTCEKYGIKCLDLPMNEDFDNNENSLTFLYDGHYSQRGHQWLGKHLSLFLFDELTK